MIKIVRLGREKRMNYIVDKISLYDHFMKDPVLFGYHLGDLDDFYFSHCRWAAAINGGGGIEEIVLIYNGVSVPTVLALGQSEHISALLAELIPELPPRFYCHYQKQLRPIFRDNFNEEYLGNHLKMKQEIPRALSPDLPEREVVRLKRGHILDLQLLYDKSYPGNYFDRRMLETGKYFGYIEDGKIVSVSGVHVYSDKYNIAVLGNIVTDPDYRGRGLAKAVTGVLVRELISEGKLITLNVKADNEPAIRCYKGLGFETTHQYEESIFIRPE